MDVESLRTESEEIVWNTIKDCLMKFYDMDFNLDSTIQDLTQNTMKYFDQVSLDEFTKVVKSIEDAFEDPNAPEWENFRKIVGMIINKTAEHYIQAAQEIARIDRNFKLNLLWCITIIGAIVPLLYYHLKVKPTHEAYVESPLVVYEMSRQVFEKATAKNNPSVQNATVHRRRQSKMYLIKNQAHLISKQGLLKSTVLMDPNLEKFAKKFNGTLEKEKFLSPNGEVRWIVTDKEKVKEIEEKLSDQEYSKVLGPSTG